MSRQVYKNVVVTEQITVWGPNGVGVTGLTIANFTNSLWYNGVVSAVVISFAEVGLGEYKFTWTPNLTGMWKRSITNTVNRMIFQETYDVVETVLAAIT